MNFIFDNRLRLAGALLSGVGTGLIYRGTYMMLEEEDSESAAKKVIRFNPTLLSSRLGYSMLFFSGVVCMATSVVCYW